MSKGSRALSRAGGNWHGKSGYNQHAGKRYKAGVYWVECERCGFDVRESNTKREWTGIIVCEGCWEPRQPQDFVRGFVDDTAAKGLVRPVTGVDNGAWDGQGTNVHTDISGSNTVNVDGSTDKAGGTWGGGGGGFDTDGFTDLEDCTVADQESTTAVSVDASTCLTCTLGATYSASGLPPGVSIDASTGSVTGTATETGVFNVITYTHCGDQTVSSSWGLTIPSFPADLGPTMNYMWITQTKVEFPASLEVFGINYGEDGDTLAYWEAIEFEGEGGGVDTKWYYEGELVSDTKVTNPDNFVAPEFTTLDTTNPNTERCLTLSNPNGTTEYGSDGGQNTPMTVDIRTMTGEHRFIVTRRVGDEVVRVRSNMYINCVVDRTASYHAYLTEGGL